VLDFGVAKAAIRTQATRDGQLKGKLSYMSPEQILGEEVTRQADIYSASVVLWEALTMRRAFQFDNEGALMGAVLKGMEDRPSHFAEGLAPAFDTVTMHGLERTAASRYPNARDMALELERCVGIASPSEIGAWVTSLAGPALAERSQLVTEIERSSASRSSLEPSTGGDSEVTQGTPVSKPRVSRQMMTATTEDVESSITFKPTQETRRPPEPRRSMLVPGLIGGAVVVMGLVAARTLMHGPTSSAGPAPSAVPVPPSSASVPVVSREPAVEGGVVSAAPASSGVTSAVPPSTSAPPDDSKPGVKRASGPSTRPAPPGVAPKAAAPADCNPPYYFDDQGHKHYKDACFR
jgi:serine/threonine-protein kinase